MSGLGRTPPPDWRHVDRFPLTALATAEQPTGVPVVFGFNWYSSFDTPEKRGSYWWLREGPNLGSIRGGHAIVGRPPNIVDTDGWWRFYDQGNTGECVGFSASRMMSLYNRARYDAPWLYFRAQEESGQPLDPQTGTYVRSGFEVLREQGHKLPSKPAPKIGAGISAYRWITSVDGVLAALGTPAAQFVRLLNSWGTNWPHYVRMPVSVLERLLAEDGECAVATDR